MTSGTMSLEPWLTEGLDYSHAGYLSSDSPPGAPAQLPLVTVSPLADPEADAAPLLQAAVDEVSALDVGADGWRGVVLIEAGRYCLDSAVVVQTGGVLLRGQGQGAAGSPTHPLPPNPHFTPLLPAVGLEPGAGR